MEFTGYCMRCKKAQKMENPVKYKMGKKKDRDAVKGTCGKCGTNMNKIMSKEDKARLGK